MAKDPAFLFYSSDFLSGICDLTMEERGQYITLLCLQHQKGNLSEKTIRLSVGSVSVDVLKKFAQDESGNFYNKRLVSEIEKRNNFTESRRNNGILGGRPSKKDKPNDNLMDNHKDTHMGNHMENENVNENTNKDLDIIKEEKPKKFDFLNSMIILGFDKKLSEEWLLVRKNKKATNTETALKTFCDEIAKSGQDKNKILEICVSRSWSGYKSTWDIGNGNLTKADERNDKNMEIMKQSMEILKQRDNGTIAITER